MAGIRDFLGFFGRKPRVRPTDYAGGPGFSVWAGIVDQQERDRQLADHGERHRTFASILTNTAIISASVRYFLNLIAKAEWAFDPARGPDGEPLPGAEEYAELAEEMLTSDPRTPWHRVVRRAAMYRFIGFSVQEWKAFRRPDGRLSFEDIRPRPQATIERWDIDPDTGDVLAMIQKRPQTSEYLYIPRGKVLYLVDDSLSDAPDGLGLLRHVVAPVERLRRYEQLEGFGFEVDLRNVPIGRVPFAALREAVENEELSEEQRKELIKPIQSFIQNHIKNPSLGLILESQPYEGQLEAGGQRVSTKDMWGMDLLSGAQTSLSDGGRAVERLNREIARILGTEQLLLGSTSGSYALSKDKTGQFYLNVDGALTEVREGVDSDLLDTLWMLNGFPEEMKPTTRTEAIRARDVEEIGRVLRDIATAGAPIYPDDPVINQVRDLMGVEHMPEESEYREIIEGMAGNPNDDPDDVPEPEDGE